MSEDLHPDWTAVTGPFFNDSSLSADEAPKLVVLYGSVATGKSTVRRSQYAKGFVALDSGETFTALGYGADDRFPPLDLTLLDSAGRAIARRAVLERRNLVIELVSNFPEQLYEVLLAAQPLGYSAQLVVVDCPLDEAIRKNTMRASHEISAYHTQKLHVGWLLDVANELPL